ncbi:MAG: glycosyltransferase [Desulfosoma sp.]
MTVANRCAISLKPMARKESGVDQPRVLFVADFFLRDMVIPGGAERNDDVLTDKLRKRNIYVETIRCGDLNNNLHVLRGFDVILIGNFTGLSDVAVKAIQQHKYIIYEHDHKYVRGRDPSVFPGFKIPDWAIINREFYAKAHKVIVLSTLCKYIIENALNIPNVINIGTSLWSDEELDHLSSLCARKVPKNNKFAVLGSRSKIKGTREAIEWCQLNCVDYEVLPPKPWKHLVECLSKYKGLVFMPQVCETFNRLVVEAKSLGCRVITNESMIGAASESLWEMSGFQLLSEIRRRVISGIDVFEREIHSIVYHDRNAYTAILTAYRRNSILREQVVSLRTQTIPPKEIWIWVNRSEDTRGVDFYRAAGVDAVFYCDRNWKYFGRFAVANLANTPYVAIFDDDTIPGPKWIENCFDTIKSHPGILGGVGVILTGCHYRNHIRVGWVQPHDEVVEVDLVGHAWFFRKEWLRFFWQEEPFTLENGEDIHFSYVAQKLGGIKTYVPAHPLWDKTRWSSIKGREYGVDSVASSSPENHAVFYFQRDLCVKSAINKGWTPLFMRKRFCTNESDTSVLGKRIVGLEGKSTLFQPLKIGNPMRIWGAKHQAGSAMENENRILACPPSGKDRSERSTTASFVTIRGIRWQSQVLNYNGYASHARRIIEALEQTGIPIMVKATAADKRFIRHLTPPEAARWQDLMRKPVGLGAYLCMAVPTLEDGTEVFSRWREENPGFCTYVGVVTFETDRLPSGWAEACNRMDEIWVPSTFNKETFTRGGVSSERIDVFPTGIDTNIFNPHRVSPLLIRNRKGFAFLSVFQWTHRKGWDVLLRAYLSAFSAQEDVCLILRTYPYRIQQPPISDRIKEYIENLGVDPQKAPSVIVLDRFIPEQYMPSLFATADAFVLPSRGEGFGLPYMEAMAMGLPVIATRWGGHLDFMDDSNSFLIDVEALQPVHSRLSEESGFYTSDQKLAEPSVSHTAELMRLVFDNRTEARRRGHAAREYIKSHWTVERSAQWFKSKLSWITS